MVSHMSFHLILKRCAINVLILTFSYTRTSMLRKFPRLPCTRTEVATVQCSGVTPLFCAVLLFYAVSYLIMNLFSSEYLPRGRIGNSSLHILFKRGTTLLPRVRQPLLSVSWLFYQIFKTYTVISLPCFSTLFWKISSINYPGTFLRKFCWCTQTQTSSSYPSGWLLTGLAHQRTGGRLSHEVNRCFCLFGSELMGTGFLLT